MTERLGRLVSVTVDRLDVSGLDVEFRIEKTIKPEPNTAEVVIYNLGREKRAQLEATRQTPRGIPVRVEAGYETTGVSQIWLGDLRTVYSVTEGPDIRTVIGSGDGEKAAQEAQIEKAFGPGTPIDVALRAIVKSMGLGEGNVTAALATLTREGRAALARPLEAGTSFVGPSARLLTDWAASAGLEWSIQDGAIQLINRGQALAQKAILLDSVSGQNTGLLDSPTVDNEGLLHARILVTPDVWPGRLVVVKSRHIEGAFRIERTVHGGNNFGGEFAIEIEGKRI